MNDLSVNTEIRPTDQVSQDDDGVLLIAGSGLFDPAWYIARNVDVGAGGMDPTQHFLHQGWQEGRCPNPYFDIEYYLADNPDVARIGINPLLHYILAGEAAGRQPSAHFDLAWYSVQFMVPDGESPLAHFLLRRMTGAVSPLPEFDPAFYLAANRDIAAAGVDPFEHYLKSGYREGRDPSATFSSRFYIQRYLGGELDQNPLAHWRQWRHALRLHTMPPAHEASVFEQVRRNSRPGPDFETHEALPRSCTRQAKLLAYYLPQFHAVAENDEWWGTGFTEWTAIARGMPRFEGHYQPRIPRDLGHYDLSAAETMRRQIALAQGAGVFGFVQYFYWFNGRRLLERPLEAFLADASLDFPFCLMWANENWTRRWDGSDQEVLISQDYHEGDDLALMACFARHFADPRYIRLSGRPVLMIYRAGLIPDCAETVARWREMFAKLGENPILVMAQSFDDCDPVLHGFDGAIEFPPHKLTARLRTRNQELRQYDTEARGQIYAYDDLASASLAEAQPAYPLIKTALPGWDNDARREGMGMALHGSTPAKYQAWLEALVDRSAEHPFHGERIVCVNAWNEWAEGAYLEPDVHYGCAYLNATGRAVARLPAVDAGERVLLVGHDAYPAGAQMLLLHLGRKLIADHGIGVEFLLLSDGALLAQYSALATTNVARDRAALTQRIAAARARGVRSALVNTSVAARVIPLLKRAGIESVLLVHEMPRLMAERAMLPGARAGAALARRVIFPAACVRDAFPVAEAVDVTRRRILPQGLYLRMGFDPAGRDRLRAELGVVEGHAVALGAGTGDLRKGFDLFLQAARIARKQNAPMHFCWIGKLDAELSRHLAPEIESALATGYVHLPGPQDDVGAWMSAADVFALTSREDPFPSVALEAMATGLSVAAFAGSGGIADLLTTHQTGSLVAMSDAGAFTQALMALAAPQGRDARIERAAVAAARFDFSAYAAELLAELRPEAPRISVVVPNHNYARYLPERLGSIFAQTLPVEEVIVLDDASTDDSVAVVRATARDWRREIRLETRHVNGGNVFLQWKRAVELARGTHIWIAEADDAAHPELLARLARMIAAHPDLDIAFCDSRAVDAEGVTTMPSYKQYYTNGGNTELQQNGVFAAADFLRNSLAERNTILNVSAVVFRTEALRAALERCHDELPNWRVAGDWRIYVDILAHSTGKIGYLSTPLNQHRRHANSVTGQLPKQDMQEEIEKMQAIIERLVVA